MPKTLTIRERVVTAEVLDRCHQEQTRLHLADGAVLTPSGWDYVNQHRLEVVRGAGPSDAPAAAPRRAAAPVQTPAPDIREVAPSLAEDTRIVQEGRCDHPDRPCGCKSEEFGSGFVQPATCSDCALGPARQEGVAEACNGCSRQPQDGQAEGSGSVDVDQLVRLITDQVMARLKELE